MGNYFATSNRSNSNPVSVPSTSSRQQPPQSTHSNRPIPQSPAEPHAEPPVPSPTSLASSEPPTTSLPFHLSPLLSSLPPTKYVPNVRVVANPSFSVPSTGFVVLDFLPDSNSPENMAYRHLLSYDATKNSITLYGMGGVGKTTILCALGRRKEILHTFHDGVWFFQLGHDITMPSFIRQLQRLVKSALPDFLEDFKKLAASEDSHREMITNLTNRLAQKRFLLLFDDVWDINSSVYKLVCAMCRNVQGSERTSLKVLSSTRDRNVADAVAPSSCIPISPGDSGTSKCREIFCSKAGISSSDIPSLSDQNQNALGHILKTCEGLPLALSVAGSAVKQLMDPGSNHCDQNAISEYWVLLEPNTMQVAEAEIGDGHSGLASALKTSLQYVEKKWEGKKKTGMLEDELSAGEMFESLCVMQKQMCLPVSAIKKLWGVREVKAGVRMLSRNSLVSEVREGSEIVGVGVHDLVLDMSMEMAKRGGGATKWHAKLLDGYRGSLNRSGGAEDGGEDEVVEWWKLDGNDKYVVDNVVRHLLGAGQASETLGLLIDYQWVERMNEDKNRVPFQKVIAELRLLQSYIVEQEKTEAGKKVTRDIEVIVKAMRHCMVPYCSKNREECRFQLHGRLRDVRSESGIVERLVSSIERYGRLPWARAGPGVLTSGGSLLKHVLGLEDDGVSMCVAAGGEEVVVGGRYGEVGVYNGWDGWKKMSLVGQEDKVVDMYYDRSSSRVYSCNSKGRVVVWKEYKMCCSVQAERIGDVEDIKFMEVFPRQGRVVLRANTGRLFTMGMEDGSPRAQNAFRTVDEYDNFMSSLTAGPSEDIVVSGWQDGTIRVLDAENLSDTENVLKGHRDWVNSLALSGDGRLLASGSRDGTVRIFDLERREQLWSSSTTHHYWVSCVVFSEDTSLLYSADEDGAICVWRLSNGGRDVSLVRILGHSMMRNIRSLCIGDGSELFALSGRSVHVWDARDLVSRDDQVGPFLPDVDIFSFSADEATMLTWNRRLKSLEIRDVYDVCECVDRIVSSVDISNLGYWPDIFAVSNNRKYVAFYERWRYAVRVYDVSEGVLRQTLADVKQVVLASIGDQQGNSASNRRSRHSRGGELDVEIDSLWFSADGSTISAVAKVGTLEQVVLGRSMKSKPICWHVSSGAVLDESQANGKTNASGTSASTGTNCEKQSSALSVKPGGVVTYEHDGKSFTIATLEHQIYRWHYCHNKACLWFTNQGGGVFHIDLMTDNNQLQSRDHRPPLPPLPQLHPPPSEDDPKHTDRDMTDQAEQVYDVFISHAGPDKWTIAKPLYDLLVALGLKVFLDTTELRPGQHAPQKMIRAMRSAKIAVVILSPEFAARKWTIKELMCFLERYGADGERGVIIIPVFYRLTLNECRDENSLFNMVDENGHNVFITEGFLQRMTWEDEYQIRDVVKVLQSLRSLTGIENSEGVTNGTSAEEKEKQKAFVKRIANAIVEGKERLESGHAAGPSG